MPAASAAGIVMMPRPSSATISPVVSISPKRLNAPARPGNRPGARSSSVGPLPDASARRAALSCRRSTVLALQSLRRHAVDEEALEDEEEEEDGKERDEARGDGRAVVGAAGRGVVVEAE